MSRARSLIVSNWLSYPTHLSISIFALTNPLTSKLFSTGERCNDIPPATFSFFFTYESLHNTVIWLTEFRDEAYIYNSIFISFYFMYTFSFDFFFLSEALHDKPILTRLYRDGTFISVIQFFVYNIAHQTIFSGTCFRDKKKKNAYLIYISLP